MVTEAVTTVVLVPALTVTPSATPTRTFSSMLELGQGRRTLTNFP